jgi:hypothetical protein
MQFDLSFGYLSSAIYGQAMVMSFREGFLAIAVIFFVSILPALFMRSPKVQR